MIVAAFKIGSAEGDPAVDEFELPKGWTPFAVEAHPAPGTPPGTARYSRVIWCYRETRGE